MQSIALGAKRATSRYRWVICGLLFFATVINYMDRQILGLLAPVLQHDVGWSQVQYGRIVMTFSAFYAVGLLCFGRLADWLGTRVSYAIAMFVWSIAAMLHATVGSVMGFAAVRALLGIGESGNFPAAIKATAEWFPSRERALATGIFNSGANIGAVFAPAIIPAIAVGYGWRAAFVVIGAAGLVWLVFWFAIYREPDSVTQDGDLDDRAHQTRIGTAVDTKTPAPGFGTLIKTREAWAFIIGKFLTDPVWWFYLFWLPKWLNESRGMDMQHIGMPLVCIYALTTVGSIGGGWISSAMIRRGSSVNVARKTAMLICACCVLPIAFVSQVENLWAAVAIVGLAAAAHQGWSANLFTTASDLFPRRAVGAVVGLGGMAGSLGGVLFSEVIGQVLQRTGHYWVLFAIGALAYLVALAIMHLLTPRMSAVRLKS
ncbi:MFS transporter [Paraburkholderia metrosideri]|jgi:MFS transporter, ACS family, hexuronate transporter|uniref:Hexuronate transporter n=1 Tax=Paraburkholderia metrosideri TaxID=580937 RepID=A0ABM8NLN5_9BURK|nr:MFS transporter [Paraburkholderia metrosideri]CAD6531816.1 Hexuronate transporter [Paraburkholderia metrosideri]